MTAGIDQDISGSPDVPAELSRRYLDLLGDVSRTGRLLRRSELESLRTLGERGAETGHGLQRMAAHCLAATRQAWRTLPGITAAVTVADLRRTGDAVLAATEAALAALGEGHERAQRTAVRQEEAARREFIDDLLYGRSDLGLLAEHAERFGLRLAGGYSVAVAVGDVPYADVHPLVHRVERELVGRFGDRDVLLATKDGRLVCIAPDCDRAVLEAFADLALRPGQGYRPVLRVATGRRHSGAGGVVHSYEEALGALDYAERLALPAQRLKAEELLVFPVLMRDREAMADLVRNVLGPLTAARGGARPLLDTIAVQAETGYVNAEAARRLGLSVRTLGYRLERIRALTGYDPADALHRYTLETAAMGARLLNWPEQVL
ncbi:helix-turn-helix domain-containing protein [Streptomyces sp. CB01881]|uniref:PucR family transcriptional regulator n=1 Tax=Streptomyces sp. CB01881 TaxID=2078691 RepID=UPI000CDC3E2A|nr:helix-turn-helix domain-containing protein [Streptomyces sp. CB01881]AUY49499.1 regulator [Streptomyces sp. CB01881]TYC72883.1 PucR family transcriptional regulator [Streptomyces sp. CB01881]